MLPQNADLQQERVLILAPTGRDAPLIASVLGEAGLIGEICHDLPHASALLQQPVGAVIAAEEAFATSSTDDFGAALRSQPPWSDLPVIVLAAARDINQGTLRTLSLLGASGNVTLLERPLRTSTLISAAQAALRARRRQYQVRDLLREVETAQKKLARHAEDLERVVTERTARLRDTIAELEAFSYTISHDLRAPLRAMQSYAQILWEDCGDHVDTLGQEYIKRIKRAGLRLDKMIQDVLDYSRVVRLNVPLEPIQLEKIFHDLIYQYPELQPPKAQIETAGPLLPVLGHEPSLTQCFANLLQNAVKFMPADRQPHIRIYTEPVGEFVRVWVEDNGIGIAPHKRERLFRMFERAHTDANYEGSGIGLAIVRKATERMGGTCGVESQVGKGSRFWIQLKAGNGTINPGSRG